MSAPRFIVVEGLDGAGKSTLAAALAVALDAEPLSTPPRALSPVRSAIDDALGESPIASQLFYAGTVAWASDRARRALADGRSVVLDRYWATTLAYATWRGESMALDAARLGLLAADFTIFVDGDDRVRAQRLARRGATRCDEESVLRADALRAAYESALRGPWVGRLLRLDSTEQGPERCVATALRAIEEISTREVA